ncbi:uncharacterized protein LOC131672335 [Phymastichus coffea]|uniref:uncharacterized protein LOC131672335 n=1 Tax=Phymastichus coffea TaxID=108790 RepID=UPI00273CE042|nr:uncharacterized protein LOC131672335 [Phymastichus coffea]
MDESRAIVNSASSSHPGGVTLYMRARTVTTQTSIRRCSSRARSRRRNSSAIASALRGDWTRARPLARERRRARRLRRLLAGRSGRRSPRRTSALGTRSLRSPCSRRRQEVTRRKRPRRAVTVQPSGSPTRPALAGPAAVGSALNAALWLLQVGGRADAAPTASRSRSRQCAAQRQLGARGPPQVRAPAGRRARARPAGADSAVQSAARMLSYVLPRDEQQQQQQQQPRPALNGGAGPGRRPRPGAAAPLLPAAELSPKHAAQRRPAPPHAKVGKDDSLYSIDSDAGIAGSERKARPVGGPKHANLKRVSFGSSKGSMVETLVYETPVQEEPETNQFGEQNGRPAAPMIPVPDTDEGREKVRVSFRGPTPFPSTPGVLLLEPIGPPADVMAASAAELLTAHTEHTVPTYHTQISTDSGWDNPFRPDGDLSREADEIVELIKGGKPITPTPGQTAPALPGCESKAATELDAAAPPSSRHQGNGQAARGAPAKPPAGQQPAAGEKGSGQVDVGRSTAQAPGDVSQVEHVTLKKKPKCKCCVLQ